MKKAYLSPEVNEVVIEVNQAIAKCGAWVSGYENSATRGCGRESGKTGYPDPWTAWRAYDQYETYTFSREENHHPWVYNIVYGETLDANGVLVSGAFNDLNSNGVYDGGDYMAWQEGGAVTDLIEVFKHNSEANVSS